MKFPTFNDKYEIYESCGEGQTSKVYLGRLLSDKTQKVAIKVFKNGYINKSRHAIPQIDNEIEILKNIKHKNIVNIISYGSDGRVVKPSGAKVEDLIYIVMEYADGGLLFDLAQGLGRMGEDAGRFFLNQMLDVLEYLHSNQTCHRDLKLENILLDQQMNLKVADFGFASNQNIDKLSTYRGTKSYMAPEVKIGGSYDGRQVDIFSTGVILFIIVQGIFPFEEAKETDFFYNMIVEKNLKTYWKKVGGNKLSNEFKDLILKMFSFDGNQRPSLQEIRQHPWLLQGQEPTQKTRNDLLERFSEKMSGSTASGNSASPSQ